MRQWARGTRAQRLSLVLLAVVAALVLIGYGADSKRREAVAQAQRNTIAWTRTAARVQSRLFADTRELMLSLSKIAQVGMPQGGKACSALAGKLRGLYPYYINLGAAAANGNVFCSANPLSEATNIADRGYFRRAAQNRGFGVGRYQSGSAAADRVIGLGQAIPDDRGSVAAVVFVALDAARFDQLIADIELPPGSNATLFDDDGGVVATYPQDAVIHSGDPRRRSPLGDAVAARNTAGTIETQDPDGVTRRYAFAPLSGSQWSDAYLAIGVPRTANTGSAIAFARNPILLLLIVSACVLIAAWYAGDTLALRRIKALVAAARRLGSGDWTARTGLPHGPDAVGQLARAFDGMGTAMQRVNRALKTLSESNRAIIHAVDERALCNEICRIVVEEGGYRNGWIAFAKQDERKSIRAVAHVGFQGGMKRLNEILADVSWAPTESRHGPVGTAIWTRKPYITQHLLEDPKYEPWRHLALSHGWGSQAVFPLWVDEQVIGAMAIYAAEPDAFAAEELELLAEAAHDLAYGIAILRTRADKNRAQAIIEHMAFYDKLTGLPNHARFEEQLVEAMARARSFDRLLAMLIVDLTRLRDVNDALGFHFGDQLLKEVGARIGGVLPSGSLLARMRGDEFAVLCTFDARDQAAGIASRILATLGMPFFINDMRLDIDATIGISVYPEDAKDGQKLMRHADVALHEAKKSGRPCRFYEPELDRDNARRFALIGELRRAIERDELVLHYQFKTDMRTGRPCGVEALIRWIHPQRGMIPPDQFIPLAEHSGLIKPMTDWVIEAALRDSSAWRQANLVLPVAVNLSALNLRDAALVDNVERSCARWNAEAHWLEFEITEGAVMDDPEGAMIILSALREKGITLFIDDFGTGYSSLSYLKKLPVDAVKIDKSFVIDMLANPDSAAIVRSTVGLAHELDLAVVAEGVENQPTWDRLLALGCDVAQGYHIARPMPADQVQRWLDQHGARVMNHRRVRKAARS